MNAPDLIQYEETIRIPMYVFDDLNLSKVFQENTITILSRGCMNDETADRRELFSLLLFGGIRDQVESLFNSIKDLERSILVMRSVQSEAERVFLHVKMLSSYLSACEKLASMIDCGVKFDRIASYFSSIERIKLYNELRHDIDELNKLLHTISYFGIYELYLNGRHYFTKESDVPSIYAKIVKISNRLNISVPIRKKSRIRPDNAISNGIIELYQDEFRRIYEIIGKYQSLDMNEVIKYKPQLAFIFDFLYLCNRADEIHTDYCIPITAVKRELVAEGLSDITLLLKNCNHIISNDANFNDENPFYFLIGANGGGKTTYLRSVGSNLILALSGCPVFAKSMRVYPFQSVITHFPADERFNGMGRLDEEAVRVNQILEAAHSDSFILFNETYSGTDADKGFNLLLKTADDIRSRCICGLFVTHFHEIAEKDYPLLHAVIDHNDCNRRTFRIERKDGKSSSYAWDILHKYKLDKASLNERRRLDG